MKATIAAPALGLMIYRAYSKNSLTPGGLVAATLTGIAHAIHPWNLPFVLLCVFFLAGTRVTHIKEDVKAKLTTSSRGSSGGEGPRNHVQVFANSLVASILSLLHAYQLHDRATNPKALLVQPTGSQAAPSLCFSWGGDLLVIGIIANYAAVAADTFSSELGILARGPPRLITSPTFRKVPPGTNGGVTLTGLGAGLLGSMIMVTTAMFFVPFCSDKTAGKLGGGRPWTQAEYRTLMGGLTIWGALGSVLDSVLGGLLQRSVKDARTGKIVEGDGGEKVLVSSTVDKNVKKAADKPSAAIDDGAGKDKHRKASSGDDRPSRVVESGWDILDNNDVNFLMAFTMSLGAMVFAAWHWGYTLGDIIP
ncbi:hypothetical protein N0V93_000933 [Gnomoniopsis smithogilvyi]|uniref:Uncharacterized protein n=1 Tax=Gnomoniopsis smithogilvyi TaxID=1191159 RepID=A0A9W8Z0S2_9PEZI|nr:hypothetical protein N0V93_000933 [Gnomoniopsis smithogilvyi]